MPDSELIAGLEPQARDELLRSLLLACLRQRATARPLLLILEDCHWIDPASQALLGFVSRHLADLPVVLVVIARTETRSALSTALSPAESLVRLRVAQLAAADAESLIEDRLRMRYGRGVGPAPEVVRQLADRGEGNPFFLEELVSLLRSRDIDPSDRRALSDLDLPPGLQRLMMARIDQLTEGEKATLKVASVIGRRFRADWIAKIYPPAGPPDEVRCHLEHLAELDLTPAYAADPEFGFKHAITQEAAYTSLTFDLRESLHERVAEVIEAAFPDRLAQHVDVLAHHYGRTRRVDKQRVWFRAAGDAAKAAFANEAAVDYYERLLPLLANPETGAVLVQLGGVWQLTGQWERADGAYRQAMDVASRSRDRALLATAQRCLGDLLMYRRSPSEAAKWLTLAAKGFEQLGDSPGLSRALERLTYTLIRQSSHTEARDTANRHLAVATAAGDFAGTCMALNHLGLIDSRTGDQTSAVALLERALEIATTAGDGPCLVHSAHNLACVHYWHGDHRQAAFYWQQALDAAQRIGHRQNVALAIGNLGEVHREQGNYADAAKCFSHALRIFAELGDWVQVASQAACLAATVAAEGNDDDAHRLFTRAVELARRLGAPYFVGYSLHHQAELYAERGRYEQAARLNSEALELAREHREREIEVRAELLSIRLDVKLGVPREAAAARLRELLAIWTEPAERAALLDLLDELNPTPDVRAEAAKLYSSLYEQSPSVEHRKRYARLTGVTLPPGPPLPPLPKDVDGEAVALTSLLRQVDRAAASLSIA
jgi:tetratricopeptide (TPR) repeat protein